MITPEPITAAAPGLTGPAVAAQLWQQVTFLHWRVESDRVRFRFGPPIPYFGTFTEVNVRLYGVDDRGRRGVVFRSLETSRLAAVITARTLFALPYRWARTAQTDREGMVNYRSRRHRTGESFALTVRPHHDQLEPDDLDHFLTARWALFTEQGRRTLRLPNSHEPWPLHRATLINVEDDLVAGTGLPGVTDRPPESVLYSPGVAARFGRPGLSR